VDNTLSTIELEKPMRLYLFIILYCLSLGGGAISAQANPNTEMFEIFSLAAVLFSVLMLPDLYHVGLNLLAQSTKLDRFTRLVLKATVFIFFCMASTCGWYLGMWGIRTVQATALSVAIVCTGGLMAIKYYWRNYWL
jgi:hypothetical protein